MAYEANKHECLLRRRIEAGEILRGLSRGIEQNKPALEGIERGFVIGSDEKNYFLQQQFTAALKAELGTNFGTLAAGMVMASPVAGLRPVRSGRS